MPSIRFIFPDGTERTANARLGTSVMRVAVDLGVPGIVGECGGGASCGTCHVWVDPQWADRLPVPDENELEMLEFVEAELRTGSRLGCQIEMQDELDGIVIAIPPLER
jgi:2Fe-2S ferredoxin